MKRGNHQTRSPRNPARLTSLAYLNHPKQREHIASLGGDAEHQHETYIRHINQRSRTGAGA
jgi:hypothetical protein